MSSLVYIATDFAKNMLKGSNPQRVGASVQYGVGVDVVARDTLKGLLKRKRQVVTPWNYWLAIKLHENAPGLIEWGIRRNMKPTYRCWPKRRRRAALRQC